MTSGESALIEHLRETIRRHGPVTFAWFMEQALYHPEHGYYSSGRARIGRTGDYFTNVSVGPLFGRLLAAQFAEMWEALGQPNEFSIVEQGSNDGQFACDVLEATQKCHPEFLNALRYEIVEPFPVLQTRQEETLRGFDEKVTWRASLAELRGFCGVHFSNELIDAMPVHLVKWNGSEWSERHVIVEQGGFEWADLPMSSALLAERLPSHGAFAAGYETEVNLNALRWIEAVSKKLSRGFVVAVDYGFPREEFYSPTRRSGTLRCYANHQVVPSPLAQVGQADITTHVEWTSLTEKGEACGLTSSGFCDQHHFITGLLAGELAREFESASDPKTKRALQTLLHPGLLGMKFQYLVLARNADPSELSGLRFARPHG